MGLVRPGAEGVAQTSDDLLRQADISMYAGKRLGKDTAVVYQSSSGVSIDFPTALRDADGGAPPGFRLVYQVVVQLPDGKPVAVEALARWTAPNGVEMSPETFVAVAEAGGAGGRPRCVGARYGVSRRSKGGPGRRYSREYRCRPAG